MLDCEDQECFLPAWQYILDKHDLAGNEWLGKLFEVKEKWSLAYERDGFSADIKATLRSENINNLKKYLDSDKFFLLF